jgi:hypothetical protein
MAGWNFTEASATRDVLKDQRKQLIVLFAAMTALGVAAGCLMATWMPSL